MADNFELKKRLMGKAKAQIKEAYSSEEYALIQAINAYLEMNKQYNLVNERLSEWNGIYVPEFSAGNMPALAKVALALSEGRLDVETLKDALENPKRAEELFGKISMGMGRKMNGEEASVFKSFAEYSIRTNDTMAVLEAYIKAAAGRLLPNAAYLTDEKIAAELLARAGSIERLAMLPAGTIQLLGAEKALFKHIKFGSRPPKYGVLFKLADVTSAPKHAKGRVARAYATKLSIAFRADYFSKRFIAKELKESLQKSVAGIMEDAAKNPPKAMPRQGAGFRAGRKRKR